MATKKLNGTVIVTYRCNARCTMCNRYKAPSKPEEEISLETIRKLPPMYFTNITGGEPFIRTDLKDIVRELRKEVGPHRHLHQRLLHRPHPRPVQGVPGHRYPHLHRGPRADQQ